MNTQINITDNGTTTLATAGKYCDRNIDVNVAVEADYTSCFDGTISGEYVDNELTTVRFGGFAGTNFTKISLPNCVELLESRNFAGCPNLEVVELPNVKTVNSLHYTFYASDKLETIVLPELESSPSGTDSAFNACTDLKRVELPKLSGTTIGNYAFRNCRNLEVVIIGGANFCPLNNTNAFSNATAAIIYVPDGLVETYKAATNWTAYANRIKPISELEE